MSLLDPFKADPDKNTFFSNRSFTYQTLNKMPARTLKNAIEYLEEERILKKWKVRKESLKINSKRKYQKRKKTERERVCV